LLGRGLFRTPGSMSARVISSLALRRFRLWWLSFNRLLRRFGAARRLRGRVLLHQKLRTEDDDRHGQEKDKHAAIHAGFVLWVLIFRHSTQWLAQVVQPSPAVRWSEVSQSFAANDLPSPVVLDQIRRARTDGSAGRGELPAATRATIHAGLRLRRHTRSRSEHTCTRVGAMAKAPTCKRATILKSKSSVFPQWTIA
jgi:hypothetical protein